MSGSYIPQPWNASDPVVVTSAMQAAVEALTLNSLKIQDTDVSLPGTITIDGGTILVTVDGITRTLATTADISPSVQVTEIDGTPTLQATTLRFPNGSLTNNGSGVVTVSISGGSSLTVTEADGSPSVAATTIRFPNGSVTDNGSGVVTVNAVGATGATGATGPAGAAGPNTVSTSTSTNITGVLYGNGTTVAAATAAERLGSVTKAELNTAVSDGNVVYVGDGLNGTLGATTPASVAATTGNFNAGLTVTGGGSSGTAGLILGSYGTLGGIFVAGTTPSASNEVFAADASTTYVNGISTLGLLVGNGNRINITASAVTIQPNTTFQNNVTGARFDNTGRLDLIGNTANGIADGVASVRLGTPKYGRYIDIGNEGYMYFPSGGGIWLNNNTTLQVGNIGVNGVWGSGIGWQLANGASSGTLSQRFATTAQTYELYGTYTDPSNYRRLRLSSTTAGAFSITAEGLGTGASGNTLALDAATSVTVFPNATTSERVVISKDGLFSYVTASIFTGNTGGSNFGFNSNNQNLTPSALQLVSSSSVHWTNSTTFGTRDVSISRNAAGVLQVGNSTTNNALGSLLLANLTASALIGLGAYTVATLPSASANAGRIAQATDSSVTTNGTAVSGGGANRVMVFSNGTTWDVVVA